MFSALSSSARAESPANSFKGSKRLDWGPRTPRRQRSAWLGSLLLAAVFFATLAPSASNDTAGGMEHFNIATALESARDHHWLIPTLYGEPRTVKPPLTEWTTALGILSSRNLEWGARWPTLLMAALTLPAIYGMGAAAGDGALGIVAAMIGGSTIFFLRYARYASYDTQLLLWVTIADAFILLAIVRQAWWAGSLGAGRTRRRADDQGAAGTARRDCSAGRDASGGMDGGPTARAPTRDRLAN